MFLIWKYFKPAYTVCCIYIHFAFVIGCQVKNTRSPLLEYRCIPNSSDEVIFRQDGHPQCEWRCMSMDSCRYINMNPSNLSCEMGFGRCMYLEPSPGYMIKAFTIPNLMCIKWVRGEEAGLERIHVFGGTNIVFQSRTQRGPSTILGRFVNHTREFRANFEGRRLIAVSTNDVIEFLTIDKNCTWSWFPYTSGEELPVGPVIGGYLASGSPVYVAKMYYGEHRIPAFGYYSGVGRYEYLDAARTATTMDILVTL